MPTPSEIDAMPDYTDPQLLKVYRYGFAQGWWGQSKTIDGRVWTFPDHGKMLDVIERLEKRVADVDDDDSDNGGVALAVFGQPR